MTGKSQSKMLAIRIAAALAIAPLLALAPAYGAADNSLTGRWFTDGFEHGAHIQVYRDIKPDGTYQKDIRVIDNCEIAAEGKENGKWTFARGNFATVRESIDGKPETGSPADTHDLFTVTRVDDEHINFFDTDTKLNWGLMLASPSDKFPAARGCGI
jgi:hypothetical protein